MLNVYVSFPKDHRPAEAAAWEAAIASRIEPSLAMVVIVDGVEGSYKVRSAHTANSGSVGDITADAIRLLREGGIL